MACDLRKRLSHLFLLEIASREGVRQCELAPQRWDNLKAPQWRSTA